ncbi:MAG: hopanoid-associated sugar epimerase [Candidatus Bruticola sp.]
MCVLVTGGTGFVGSHLVRCLLDRGRKVRALVRPSSNLANLKGLDIEYVQGDLRDADSLKAAVKGCRLVFHCAADYRLWAENVNELYQSNVQGTENLLIACREGGVERTVVTSSVAAVGLPKNGGPGNEDEPVCLEDMIGHYKRSKFLAEQVALKAAAQGQNIVIVNPSTPIGDRDIKPTDTGRIITRFLNGAMPAYVNTGLNLVDVQDVCQGHILAAQKGKSGERYILGGWDMTLQQILLELSDISGLKAPVVELPLWFAYAVGAVDTFICSRLHKVPDVPLEGVKMARKLMYFSWQKARRELGYEPKPIRPALERAVKWFADNGYVKKNIKIK